MIRGSLTLSPYAHEVASELVFEKAKTGTVDRQRALAMLSRERSAGELCDHEITEIRGMFTELVGEEAA